MAAPRTNILSANPPPPRTRDPREIQAWILNVAQTLRYVTTGRTTTTGSTPTSIVTIQTDPDAVYGLKIYIVGRRTAGSGSFNDGYVGYARATYRNVAGTLTEIAEDIEFEATDITGATLSVTVSDQKISINVIGAASTEITWTAWTQTLIAA